MAADSAILTKETQDGIQFKLRLIQEVSADKIQIVRFWMRDYKEKNKLLRDQEFTDEQIALAIVHGIDSMNNVPPLDEPLAIKGQALSLDLFLGFTQIALLENTINERMRNFLNYAEGGVSIDTSKYKEYLQLLGIQRQYYVDKAAAMKTYINVNDGTQLLPSPYLGTYLIL